MHWIPSSSFPHRPGRDISSSNRLGEIVKSSMWGNNDRGSARFCGLRRSRATRGSLSTRNGPLQRIIVWVVHGGCVVRRNEGRKCAAQTTRRNPRQRASWWKPRATQSALTHPQSGGRRERFEEKSMERAILNDLQRCERVRPSHALDTGDAHMRVLGWSVGF